MQKYILLIASLLTFLEGAGAEKLPNFNETNLKTIILLSSKPQEKELIYKILTVTDTNDLTSEELYNARLILNRIMAELYTAQPMFSL